MRIALISSEKLPVPPIRGGAVQTYIASVAARLARRHDVTVYGAPDPELAWEEVIDGVRYVRVNCTINDQLSYLEGLVKLLRQEKVPYDVIEVFNRPIFVLPIHAAAPESRLVLSLHNEMFRETKIPKEVAKQTIAVLDKIITVSDYIASHVRERYPEADSKLQTIYAGVDIDDFPKRGSAKAAALARDAKTALAIDSGPIILYVGRLSKSKGPDILLDAMPEVVARYPDAKLVMVGSQKFGSNVTNRYVEEIWKKAAPLGKNVIFAGYIPYQDVNKYFAAGDVFVCSSQWNEPLARVHYEAMAAGLPIITTNRGGNPEVVVEGVNGIVINAWNEPQAFAQAILTILGNPTLAKKMSRACRELAETRYTWDHTAANLEHALIEAYEKRPGIDITVAPSGQLAKPGSKPTALLREVHYSDTMRKIALRTLHAQLLTQKLKK